MAHTNSLLAAASFGLVAALCHSAEMGRHSVSADGSRSHQAGSSERVASSVPELHVLDEWSWVSGRCDQYDDNIHHPKLAVAHVRSLLDHACTTLPSSKASNRP